MFDNERDYAPALKALKPVLHNLPGKIVAIGGSPGVGKTTLGRYLASRFNVSLIETDLFLIRGQGNMVYREDWINQVISSRLDRADPDWQRPVIIEGATVLRLLASIGRKPDFIIHVVNHDAPESEGTLAEDLKSYEVAYAPASKADIVLNFSD
ncbi:AAA family ATPase [Pararhizobium arenae]|uniref:AAA family ATPase n=1 Tax=Pararhizobium arenae TaxID=1856850 RepID=UPI00094AE224|nr:AAA family ATPase [Pararhizobium arenae]